MSYGGLSVYYFDEKFPQEFIAMETSEISSSSNYISNNHNKNEKNNYKSLTDNVSICIDEWIDH